MTRLLELRRFESMTRRNLPSVAATLVFVFGCSSSNSDGGAGGATTGAAGDSGASAAGSGATATGGTSAGGGTAGSGSSTAGSGSATAGSGGLTSGIAGSSGGGEDLPPVDSGADARKLSDSDKGLLCDWMNEKLGGYGLMTECSPSFSVMNLPNQAVCITSFFNFDCKVTVQDVETCTLARAPSHACDGNPVGCHRLFCQQ